MYLLAGNPNADLSKAIVHWKAFCVGAGEIFRQKIMVAATCRDLGKNRFWKKNGVVMMLIVT